MEEKNNVIRKYADCLTTYAGVLNTCASQLQPAGEEENEAIITSLNIQLETIRSGVVVLQNALDHYKG